MSTKVEDATWKELSVQLGRLRVSVHIWMMLVGVTPESHGTENKGKGGAVTTGVAEGFTTKGTLSRTQRPEAWGNSWHAERITGAKAPGKGSCRQ